MIIKRQLPPCAASWKRYRTRVGCGRNSTWRCRRTSKPTRHEKSASERVNSTPAWRKLRLDYLTEQKDTLPAAQYLKQAKALRALFPADPDIAWALEEAYDAAEMKTDALPAARAAGRLQQGPEGQSRLLDVLNDADRDSEIAAVLSAALQRYPNDVTLIQWRADYLKKKGNIPAAIALYQRLLQIDTPWPNYRRELADLYIAAGNKTSAVQVLRTAREQCPNDDELCEHLADELLDLGNKKDAIALYKEAIRLKPGKVDWRERLQVVSGEQPAMNLLAATPVDPILKEAATMQAPAATSAIMLLNEARMVVYADYASDIRHRMIVKVFDDAGVKRFGNIDLEPLDFSQQHHG